MPESLDWVAYRAKQSPDRDAFSFEGRVWSYRELQEKVARYAELLHNQGVHATDRIGLLTENNMAAIVAIFAIQRLGAVPVMFNTRLKSAKVLEQFNFSGCKQLYGSENFSKDENYTHDFVQALIPLEYVESIDPAQPLDTQFLERRIRFSEPCVILFTSGSSGAASGVELSYGNLFWSTSGSSLRLGNWPYDRWLACLPLFHVGGFSIIIRGLLDGIPIAIQKGFSTDKITKTLIGEKITLISLVPTMLHRLVETDSSIFESTNLRVVLTGGAQLQRPLLERSLSLGLPIALTYGMTQAASQIATANPSQVTKKPGSVGHPLFFNKLVIQNASDRPSRPGEIGEVVVEGPTIGQDFSLPQVGGGHPVGKRRLHTGDLGYLDSDGDLWIVGRQDRVINSGGEKIYPFEVEEALLGHPRVLEAQVFGIADTEWGEKVSAAIVPYAGQEIRPNELIEFLRQKLGNYKIPRSYIFMDHFPRTGSGKIDRVKVKEKLKAQYDN